MLSFEISKDLSGNIFNKMLANHDPFTLIASSGDRNIEVKRENIEGEDKYTFSSWAS